LKGDFLAEWKRCSLPVVSMLTKDDKSIEEGCNVKHDPCVLGESLNSALIARVEK
jgi:hypothetical protein